ncbi:hypothetical protein C1646_718154 [Rhizophagus diaphanus]|nr:hypothetical protein C1646_718154 [Rhizophagus diaphanus] [Rhizophagus sp. MUCL 43196]
MKARLEIMRNIGPCQNPFGSFLLIQGVNKEMIRVSVGYEHIDDIKEDFTIAFEKIKEIN